MPGKRPPSATPSRARTDTNEANPVTKPKHMVRIPQTAVRAGSQIFGDTFFRTRFDGNSLLPHQLLSIMSSHLLSVPGDVCGIEDTQADSVLMIVDVQIRLKTQDLRIANIRAVDKRAQEQQREDWQYPASVSMSLVLKSSRMQT